MVEELGYDSVWLYDHFYPMCKESGWSILEPWTALSYLASIEGEIRIGIMVTCNSYRSPAILAKIASTVDVVSGGRLEFGIGAGWFRDEYEAYGIPFLSAAIRIEQLDEAVELIKKIWTQDKVTYEGKYYRVKDLIAYPKPAQKPHPPIWIGGSGDKLLRVTAKHADYSNFVNIDPERYEERLKALKRRCDEVGRSFDEIVKTWHGFAAIGDEESVKRRVSRFMKTTTIYDISRMSFEDFLGRMIAGSPDKCIEKIQRFVDLGVTYFIPHFLFDRELRDAETFIKEVAPSFR